MGDKEIMGLLMGLGLAVAFVAYLIHVYVHPDRFGWLALTAKAAPPSAEAEHVPAEAGTPPTS